MESRPGSQEGGHWRGLINPSWTRRSMILQGVLMLVIISTHSQRVGADRDMNIIVPDSSGPWDKALKTERHCLDFHRKNSSTYYFYWPEDDPKAQFEYCCVVDSLKGILQNYTHGIFGPRLDVAKYYDLGLIDRCLPYWKCTHLFVSSFETNLYRIYCETGDLRKLYKRRFWAGTVLKHGLLGSAIPFIITLETVVVLLVVLYCCTWRRSVDGSNSMIVAGSKAWLRHSRKTVFTDWTHLCLLAIIGNGLVEAVGRQNVYSAQAKSFYNYARLYVVLSILVWHSSLLQQVSYWIAEIDMKYQEYKAPAEQETAGKSQAAAAHSSKQEIRITKSAEHRNLSRQPSEIVELEKRFALSDDWKWQPIAAQTGILFCLWGFLTSATDDDESTTGSVLGLIVSAACPWSGLYASKIVVRAIPWLLRRLHKNHCKHRPRQILPPQSCQPRPSYQPHWRALLHVHRWTGYRRQSVDGLAQREDPGSFLELEENEPPV